MKKQLIVVRLFQLYGEKWNSLAPKFAANLGLSPLEPMKIPSSSSHDGDIKATKTIPEVPAAQFDWNSSGLINPLDGKLQYVYSLIKSRSNTPVETGLLQPLV